MDMGNLYMNKKSSIKKSLKNNSFNSKTFIDIVHQENTVRMSDGTYAFKVDIDLNQGNTLSKKEIVAIIRSLGPQIITLDKDVININKYSSSEYTYGSSSSKMYPDIVNKKNNIAPYVKKAIQTSNYEYSQNNDKLTGTSKKVAPDGFDKRTARIIDKSGNIYELNLVIGINKNTLSPYYGKNFYDISEIKTSALKTASPEGLALHSTDVMNSISKKSENVKTDMQIELEKVGLINTKES